VRLQGRCVNPGRAEGDALVSRGPLSFYGGVDPKTGVVIEKGHELEGKCVKGKVLVFPHGKGSTVGSYVIYALKSNGVAPAAIVNEETETIVATGVILADIPCVDRVDVELIRTGDWVVVDANRGIVLVGERGGGEEAGGRPKGKEGAAREGGG
jgi:predicted aconitase with swiveling domain